MNPQVGKNPFVLRVATSFAVLVPLFLGCAFYFRSSGIPGDLGDSRFNMYILEHGYRWAAGLDHSFWSAPFFYPAKNVVAYSDNLLGSLPFYLAFRWVGNSRESAFQLWTLVVFFLNYLSAYWILRKWQFSRSGAVAGGYLFAFGLPVMAQAGMHMQLIPRFAVPFAFFFFDRFLKLRGVANFGLFLLFALWQIYIGIYTGYFLCLLLFLLWGSDWLRSFWRSENLRWGDPGFFQRFRIYVFKSIRTLPGFLSRKHLPYWCATGFFVLSLLPLAIPYGDVAHSIGGRSWGEISSMLPRLSSYFRDPESVLYGSFANFGEDLPLPWEHMLFVGLIPFACLASFPFITMKSMDYARSDSLKRVYLSLWLAFFLTLDLGGFSIYWILAHFPGADAIRSVTRLVVVLLFPISAIVAAMLTELQQRFSSHLIHSNGLVRVLPGMLGGIAVLFVMADQLSRLSLYDKKAEVSRVKLLDRRIFAEEKAQGILGKNVVIWVNPGQGTFVENQLDAMLSGQDLNIPTINGYSGNIPPSYGGELFLLKRSRCEEFNRWISLNAKDFHDRRIEILGDSCFATHPSDRTHS